MFLKKTVHRGHNDTGSEVRHIVWCRCAGPRRFSHDSRGIACGSMSSSSPPDDKAIALRRSMTLHHRDVQQNCSFESDIKRNQCQKENIEEKAIDNDLTMQGRAAFKIDDFPDVWNKVF